MHCFIRYLSSLSDISADKTIHCHIVICVLNITRKYVDPVPTYCAAVRLEQP